MRRSILFALFLFILALSILLLSEFFLKVSQSPRRTVSPQMVPNGGFERYSPLSKKGPWKAEPVELFSWNIFSHSGQKALLVDASRLGGASQAVVSCALGGVRPDIHHLLELYLLRDRNVVGEYPTVSLFGQEQRLSDFWAQEKWQKFSFFFKSPPGETEASGQFLKIMIPGESYKLWVDDISLREFAVRSLKPESEARVGGQFITFSWSSPDTDRLLRVKIVLSRDERFTGNDVLEFETDNRKSELQVPNAFAEGGWYWRVEMYQHRKLIAASSPRFFTVEESYKAEKPALKEHKIVNLDFFPVGLYNATSADFRELSALGFTAVHISPADDESLRKLLESAHQNHLKALIPFRERILGYKAFSPPEGGEPWSLSSDTVLGWYLDDEPEGRSVSPKAILQRLDYLRDNGFSQLGAIALCRSWRAVDYLQATDVIMSDPYPVPFNPLSWLSTCLDEVHSAIGEDPAKKAWAVIQAFDWSTSSPTVRKTGLGREPTAGEVKAMTYLAVIHRASGIFYYAYQTGKHWLRERETLWEGIKETVRELKTISPLPYVPELKEAVRVECDSRDEWGIPAVHFIGKDLSPNTERKNSSSLIRGIYLIGVNTLAEPASAEIHLLSPALINFRQAKDVFTGKGYLLSGSSLSLSFAPFERKVLLFK